MSRMVFRTAVGFLACAAMVGLLGVAIARQTLPTNETACLSNLKQASTALLMYVQDYDERLPPMQSMAGVHKRLQPYVKNMTVFTCPATTKPYRTNPVLSGKALAAIAEPAKAVTFYDAAPHADGLNTVAYLDGHVDREAKVPSLAAKLVVKKAQSNGKKPRSKH